MDRYEATKVVFSRIQSLDPENASKIMGLLLIQDQADNEMIRLAFGPESLIHTVVLNARQELGISANNDNTTLSTPSSPFPNATTPSSAATNNPHPLSRQASRIFLPNGLKIPSTLSVPSLSSPSSVSSPSPSPSPSWGTSVFSSSEDLVSPVRNGIGSGNVNLPANELIDEIQLQDQLSFLNDPAEFLNFPAAGWALNHQHHHRRSCSVSDMNSLEGGLGGGPLGWKPCLYYARGYCKNGTSCRFVHHHGGVGGGFVVGDPDSVLVGSPTSKVDAVELLRSKSLQHPKLLAAYHYLTANGGSGSLSPYPGSKTSSLNFLAQQQQQSESQRSAAAAMLMGEDMHKLARSRLNNRADYLMSYGGGDSNPGSRQIYLTFPADSTFREEDVSSYFSIYGPVQDVRIPYQQKRMFGFVTFLYPETVKIILAKGNPHFVCDARVLVKPYKEKGKVPDKFRKQQLQQQLERGDFPVCASPTGLDSRDPFDHQLGARMMYSTTQDLRRKLEEQADLQQALDLQSRRLLGLSLDLKRSHHHRALSTGAAPLPSPTSYTPSFNQPPQFSSSSSDRSSPDTCQENDSVAVLDNSKALQAQIVSNNVNDMEKGGSVSKGGRNCNGKESPPLGHIEDDSTNLPESLDHNLPDSPFASPTKECGGDRMATLSSLVSNYDAIDHHHDHATNGVASLEPSFAASNNNNNNIVAPSSLFPGSPPTLDMVPFSSCYFQMPRFASGHGAIGM